MMRFAYRFCTALAKERLSMSLTRKNSNLSLSALGVVNELCNSIIWFTWLTSNCPISPMTKGSSVVKALKGRRALMFFKKHPDLKKQKCWGGHLWSPSYYFGSVGNMSKEIVEKYINDQVYNAIKDGRPYPSPTLK